MYPITFWLRKVKVGRKEYYTASLFRCDIYQDRMEIYKKDENIYKLPLKDIHDVKLRYRVVSRLYPIYNELILGDSLEKFIIEPGNPVYPNKKGFTNLAEAESLKRVIIEIKESGQTSIEPNPYVRNKYLMHFIRNLDSLDKTIRPELFYERYVRKSENIYLFMIGIVIPAIITIVFLIVMLILYP